MKAAAMLENATIIRKLRKNGYSSSRATACRYGRRV
jgi:hypothetical protein